MLPLTRGDDDSAVMQALGYDRFFVAGHDRGGRTVHRMCLDHPDKVLKAAIIDIVPTLDMWAAMDKAGPALPQGRPVLVQAGQSPEGRDFAARTAEAIFCPAANIDAGIDFRNDMRNRIGRLILCPSTRHPAAAGTPTATSDPSK